MKLLLLLSVSTCPRQPGAWWSTRTEAEGSPAAESPLASHASGLLSRLACLASHVSPRMCPTPLVSHRMPRVKCTPAAQFAKLADYVAFYASKVDACWVGDEQVAAQEGDFYGGWITSRVVGPFKGAPGTRFW